MYKTFCINLDRQPEKWQRLQQSVTWPVERFSAVDEKVTPDRPSHMTAFMYGCLQSHKSLWCKVARGSETCLILEDDCEFSGSFVQDLSKLMSTIPSDFDLAVIGHSGNDVDGDTLLAAGCYPVMRRRTPRRVNAEWNVPGIWIGSHCYLLTPAGAQKLCRNTDMYHADAVINRESSLIVYCPNSSLVSQTVRVGRWMYNDHVTYEWLLLEPIIAVGDMTVRLGYLVAAYAALTGALLLSKRESFRTIGCAVAALPVIHFFGTKSHMNAGRRRTYIETASHNEEMENLHKVNDLLSASTVALMGAVAHKQGCFHTVMRAYIGLITTKMIVSSMFEADDPSCICDRRSLRKNTLFEYCSDAKVSGHIIPALVLANLAPKLGLPVVAAQTFTIMASKSHQLQDLGWSVVLVQACFAVLNRRCKM